MFESSQSTFLLIGSLASLALFILIFKQLFFPKKNFYPKPMMTAFERRMFMRLKQAFPEHHILAQVAFSALITNSHYKIRALFNRKVTDFVILNADMQVIAIIELDDPSHIGKEQEDAERDAMFHEAGYRVVRYTEIPSIRQLQSDLS
ncbi:DUF2726 domain-containing protein [Acinetobacter towneri]|uniref:DUF2726 domain-containing protein n=1 Tax=Acinetobacter towneri TaxID=202956 RepID=A0AB35LZ15_9GAMM|nr:DUF2726 domain-containing protein [Acinetobacter towneri]MDM1718499.1 DUF2726 domain-containing protein [Acinetobacter towneri]MDM1721114.1 DUF2726 domain-containing protein [Acinetobacter towneri]MDM1730417.1 DUF2726 domain-containing protein [Acinetobacter towneri]MDM1733013.1 DUF2726 domain-containing protein [Acinetobacter towneri]MDM1735412.1 DUF2726 domain-containing protein [Acinetobacter towneri]